MIHSRTKIIFLIITLWILLVSLILIVSGSLLVKGFQKLEQNIAMDNARRIAHILITILNNDSLDKVHDFIQNKNSNIINPYLPEDFFIKNKVNYVLIFDNNRKVVWSSGFDLAHKKSIPIEPHIISFFKNNGLDLLTNKGKYYSVIKKQYESSGFMALANNNIGYFSISFIKDSHNTKSTLRYMVFGRILTSEYLNHLSSDLNIPIYLISLARMQKNPEDKKIIDQLNSHKLIYTQPLNNTTYLSYLLIKDFTDKPIGLIKIEQPRKVYNESNRSALNSQLILLGVSIAAMLGMSVLVYLFFRKQDLITCSFERFVPRQLIELLQKQNILEIDLGNYTRKTISVLFVDIRNFTAISEVLKPQENFDFINMILKRIAPVISENNGFIDKYIGDAIMALFPKEATNADDAVKAAKMILEELAKLNQEEVLKIKEEVKIGIGINTGEAILGIIGAEGRLEGTVISDMVNTASRIQNLTKAYGHELLISKACYKAMKHPELYTIQLVDKVSLKGKSLKISVYSVY
ncbi:adenylate/guanylate cyclase domain-containing protein [Legionella cincinnatiensis]|uniref:Guanylate/adenylate cyclase n=1 Tax=Legionella cincinnatiensis TaxID=28085 RepID=A0A378IH37_9GAMM|nr:adenylate/guanylate cyclase domain-containing protein [Legionella cincinnatiensis]KTC91760.1 guanylate/adenylate cyclase [Legionella cincinnatiensis]STX34537.1 guanylate/adenylate cyclase [Legionella cincinnatiensis]